MDVDISHTYVSDLSVVLIAPDGTIALLHDRAGAGSHDINQTYAPNLAGTSLNGNWALRMNDAGIDDTGTLNEWTLSIEYDEADITLAGSGSRYLASVPATQNGTYNLDIVPNSGISDLAGNPLSGDDPPVDQSFQVAIPDPATVTVDAGPDQTAMGGQTVTLNGTATTTAAVVNGDPLTYSWTHDSALAVSFANSTSPSTTFAAPQVISNTTLTLTLTAGSGTATASDSVDILIIPTQNAHGPPTFVASELDIDAGVLAITFSETIDAASVVPTDIHIREQGNYVHGTTLTAGELDTVADGATISFTLTGQHRAAVERLVTPELTIDPGAVRDASGNPIVGTFDASAKSFVDATRIRAQETQPRDIAFSNDGTKMFIVGDVRNNINEYDLSTPFDASTRTFVDATRIMGNNYQPRGMAFSNDGAKLFVVDYIRDSVNEYTLSVPFDASTLTFVDATSIRAQEDDPRSVAFSNDGTKMFVMGVIGDDINEYALSVPFDASTRTFVDATSISSEETFPTGMVFSNDGAKLFVVGWTNHVNEYALSVPFDASTLTYVDDTPISSEEDDSQGIAFSSDGAKMFIIGILGDDVNEYDLSSVYPVTVTRAPSVLAGAFVTTWDAAAGSRTISMSLSVYSGGVLSIDWGDNSTDAVAASGMQSHTYAAPGKYRVSMTGDLAGINLAAAGSTASRLASIDSWADVKWSSMEGAFQGASGMAYNAVDAPDLSRVASMQNMFLDAASFDGDISSWDVSGVADMGGMFHTASDFDGDISKWNTSSVTDMEHMFFAARSFNQDISGWNVSSAETMSSMLTGAGKFKQNLGNWYVVLNGTSIDYEVPGVVGRISAQNSYLDGQSPEYGIGTGGDSRLFGIVNGNSLNMISVEAKSAYEVNVTASGTGIFGDGNNWHMLNVTVPDQDILPAGAFVTTWDATSFPHTPFPHTIFIPLEVHSGGTITIDWGDGSTDAVTANGTQSHAYSGPGDYQVSMTGDLSRINLGAMNAPVYNLASIDQWGDAKWSSMEGAFASAPGMTYRATDSPDLSGVSSMNSAFISAALFDGNLSGWDVSGVTDMYSAFYGTSSFNGDVSSWNVSSVTDMGRMFRGATSFDQPLDSWDVSSVTDMHYMFSRAYSFDQPLDSWDVSSVTDMRSMLRVAKSFDQPLDSWNVSSVTDMGYMFGDAKSFDQPLDSWDVSGVANMGYMFNRAKSFDQPLDSWDVSGVASMKGMFNRANSFDQPLDSWDVSGVYHMRYMFNHAKSFDQPLDSWDVSGVNHMEYMFDGADSFDQNLGEWYVVPGDTSIARSDVPGIVGTISAQSRFLDDQSPEYAIGTGGDSHLFGIVNGNGLNMTSVETKSEYDVNVTASGTDVFEDGNNWRMVVGVTVSGQDNSLPTVDAGPDQAVREGLTVTLSGTATDDDGDALTYRWSHDSATNMPFNASSPVATFVAPQVDADTTVTFTLTVNDGSANSTDTVLVTVRDVPTDTDFVTTWETTAPGESITIPARGTYTVDWGDGTIDAGVRGEQAHAYDVPGNHTVRISDNITGIYLNGHADAPKLRSIDQMGRRGMGVDVFCIQGRLKHGPARD